EVLLQFPVIQNGRQFRSSKYIIERFLMNPALKVDRVMLFSANRFSDGLGWRFLFGFLCNIR
ncbi:MAG: hypothetical protein ACI9Y1_001072, partial [Lentisphaeria bacterium]